MIRKPKIFKLQYNHRKSEDMNNNKVLEKYKSNVLRLIDINNKSFPRIHQLNIPNVDWRFKQAQQTLQAVNLRYQNDGDKIIAKIMNRPMKIDLFPLSHRHVHLKHDNIKQLNKTYIKDE